MKKVPISEKELQSFGNYSNRLSIVKSDYDGDEGNTTFTQDSYFITDWTVSVQSMEMTSNNTLDIPHTEYYVPDWGTYDSYNYNNE